MPAPGYEAVLNSRQQLINQFVKNTVTTATISAPPDYTFGPGGLVLEPGMLFFLHASGRMSNTATPTIKLGFYYGGIPAVGVTLAETLAFTTITTTVNWQWEIEAYLTILTTGAAGTAWCAGGISQFPLTVNTQQIRTLPEVAPVAIALGDTSLAKTLTVGVTWGTSSVSNTTTTDLFFVRSLN